MDPPFAERRPVQGSSDRGSASAELVIATPLLLLLILGVIQFALWQHASHVAKATAQQGLAVGRLENGSETSAREEATALLAQLGAVTDPHVDVRRTDDTTLIDGAGKMLQRDWTRHFLPRPQVRAGETVTLDLELTAPEAPGRYRLRIDPVLEGVSWFADVGSKPLELKLKVEAG